MRLAKLQSQNDLPALEAEKREVEEKLDETRQEAAEIEAELEELDTDLEESRDQKEELEGLFSDLRNAQSRVEDIEFELETERTTIDELEAERENLETDSEENRELETNVEHLEGQITELRERKRALEETISKLQSVIGFNEEQLEDDGTSLTQLVERARTDETGAVTDELLAGEQTECWTCGSTVEKSNIEETLDNLRELRKEQLSERNDIETRIEELTEEQKQIRQQKRQRERNERRLETIEERLEKTTERIDQLENKREKVNKEIEQLEAEIEAFEETDYSEVLDKHREANKLDLEIDRLENELEDINSKIRERKTATDSREELVSRREDINEELTELRTRVERIENDAIDSFNEHIESILDLLEYENIDRIWIERRQETVREGRRKVQKSTFGLHVVRSQDGTTYRDTVENLSESEREVTGLVFALAGYLVHDVHEELPVILLDSLEAIDAERIAAVVDYFEQFVDHLILALLPEDAQALSDDYAYIREI